MAGPVARSDVRGGITPDDPGPPRALVVAVVAVAAAVTAWNLASYAGVVRSASTPARGLWAAWGEAVSPP